MTLSAVGSAVFSSSDDHQNSKNPSIVTPSKNERAQQQQLSPVLSPTSPSSSTVGGVHDSSFSDMTFTPPHPSTQLKILSSEKANHFSHHPQPQPGDFSARCHGVSEKLHHLATSLEQWTMLVLNSSGSSMSNIAEDKDNPMTIQRVKDHLVPDMVSRLRYLSGVLDGTIDLKDYDEIFGSDSLGSSNVLPDLTLAERNDDSVLSATSTLTPSRPVNSSRLISRAYDSDDSTNFQPSPAPQPTSQKDDVLLSDWKGSGRSSDPDHTLDDFEPGTNISPIQILYSKPSNQKLKYSRQDT